MRLVGVLDWVVQDAHGAHDLASPLALAREVALVSNNELALGCLSVAFHSNSFARITIDNLRVWLGKHVRSTVNRTEAGKGLGQFPKAIQRVDVRRLDTLESQQRFVVQLNLVDGRERRLIHVRILSVKCDGMADEIDGLGLQPILCIHVPHCYACEVHSLVRFGIFCCVVLHKQKEAPRPALFEDAHEWGLQGLVVVSRDLLDLALHIHVAPIHSLEFQILCHISMNQNSNKLAIAHDEFRDHVNIVVPIRS
mmetsp:Transcript_27646/g.71100  ORF Transcript_27646/g.71100 Transcript_27646/m.71100 type:complete len:253 (+) Transcript_27646:1753-2511(+)